MKINLSLSAAATTALFCFSCATSKSPSLEEERQALLASAYVELTAHTEEFNRYIGRPPSDGPFNEENNLDFLQKNIPVFSCSDPGITKVYNYRWWMISKHLKEYNDPEDGKKYWVVTEFFGVKPWASLSGAITCPAGHQFYDVRWLRDPKYLRSYADYFMRGSASRLNQRENANFLTYLSRPESHHFSSWMINGIEAYLKIHPDTSWLKGILPHLEKHQQVWDNLFTVQRPGAKTDGMYKILDLYDGMEFSLSAVLGLIESEGAYDIYTKDSWKNYYLGWSTTAAAAKTDKAGQYPQAYRSGYPDFYLVRPSVNSYVYGNLKSLASLYRLAGTDSLKAGLREVGLTRADLQRDGLREADLRRADLGKTGLYDQRASALQSKVLDILWNKDDNFFNTFSAGDNLYGVCDFEARVRESVGYTPWYFRLIPEEDHHPYSKAWEMFGSEQGFYNMQGMTTAERQHPYYNEQAYAWNGRGWPFQNSVVYKSFANYLRYYKKEADAADKNLLFDHIEKLSALHGRDELNIGEWYIPSNGKEFGGEKDYFHSTFPDIILEDLIGFSPSHENSFTIHPLLPDGKWEYFFLGNLRYHGHDVDIAWKKDGNARKKGDQPLLFVWIDGKLSARISNPDKATKVRLP